MNESHPQWGGGTAQRTMWLVGCVLLFGAVPMLADKWVFDHAHYKNVYDQDWARLLRVMGFAPTWGIGALAMWLHERPADAARAASRAWYLVTAPIAGGLLAEILKLLLRRQRPEVNDGFYGFRPWSDHPFSTGGLAWPSSHTMVAFAAATAMARLFPRARWVWYALAAGCGVTRILAHAHFLSDVTLGALFGWCVGWGVWFVMRDRTRATG
ncbi:MAG: phosphatase PAP2 family protein [Gemmatimonadetes bacterium]|jgi:membrane-associated phospholipid phosphatase|nr:phosphatase PAP2 family protein [Gemmatimonadota bacterium]